MNTTICIIWLQICAVTARIQPPNNQSVSTLAAPTGNQFWLARASHGRDKIFSSPEVLWEAALEYFQWVEDNPLIEHKVTQYMGKPIKMEVPKMRAMTIDGLCLFLDIDEQTLTNYQKRDDFIGIVTKIKKTIRDQKLTGAAADLLNANIIAREIGLKDTTAHEHSGPDGGPIMVTRTVVDPSTPNET